MQLFVYQFVKLDHVFYSVRNYYSVEKGEISSSVGWWIELCREAVKTSLSSYPFALVLHPAALLQLVLGSVVLDSVNHG